MATQRRLVVQEDLNRGYGNTTVPTDTGGARLANKVGIHSLMGDFYNVRDFGAFGDGSTDDAGAINAAQAAIPSHGGTLYFPPGNYNIKSQISIPANVNWRGESRMVSKITKGFNGDAIVMGSGSSLERLYLIGGNGSSFTGNMVLISTGFNQYIDRCQINDTQGYCVKYTAAQAGSGGHISNSLLGTRNYPYVAVLLPNDNGLASPRCMSNCRGGGATLVDFNACDDFFMDNCFTDSLLWSGGATSSTNVMINNCRIAQGGSDDITISGSQTHIFGCILAAHVVFDANSNNCILQGLVPDWAITDSGTHNSFYQRQVQYTPTWIQGSGTQPVLGNGTLTGVYSRNGAMVDVTILLTAGTTTTFGNALTAYRFSLPYASNNSGFTLRQIGDAYVTDSSAGGVFTTCQADLGAGLSYATILEPTGGSVRSDTPYVLATGDTIRIYLRYLVD